MYYLQEFSGILAQIQHLQAITIACQKVKLPPHLSDGYRNFIRESKIQYRRIANEKVISRHKTNELVKSNLSTCLLLRKHLHQFCNLFRQFTYLSYNWLFICRNFIKTRSDDVWLLKQQGEPFWPLDINTNPVKDVYQGKKI